MPFGWDGGMKTRTSLFRWPETSPVPRTLKVPAPQHPKSLISLIGWQFSYATVDGGSSKNMAAGCTAMFGTRRELEVLVRTSAPS